MKFEDFLRIARFLSQPVCSFFVVLKLQQKLLRSQCFDS